MATTHYAEPQPANHAVVIEEQLRCALTGKPISADTAYWAPPLVTASELVSTIVRGVLHSPGTLSQVLLAEQPNVPYDPAVRAQLAARRSSEQVKLLVGLLLAIAVIVVPILFLAMR
jgi:hypothetical protein